ncbi:PilZ domain-containing protein [Paenibacillus sp. 1P07SE]|uniref:PilZ domain-containing protein n=1 Tax=Paenibacillus sp. 1P07SE TaxID=3132209 RepID=UPI0039A4DB75
MIIRTKTKTSRRKQPRLRLSPALNADLAICEIRGQAVTTRSRPVLVLDASPGGCSIMSVLDLPVSPDYALELNIAEPLRLELRGQVRWKRREGNFFEYGIAYVPAPSSSLHYQIVCLLNRLLLQQSPAQAKIHSLYQQLSGLSRR